MYTDDRQPVGFYPPCDNIGDYEPGYVGYLSSVAGAGGYAEQTATMICVNLLDAPVFTTAADDDESFLCGVIDDSTTGIDGGTLLGSRLITYSAPDRETPASYPVTQNTTAASGQISLWMHQGIYATDQYDQSIDPWSDPIDLACGDPLYALNGQLTSDTFGTGSRVATFIEFRTSQQFGMRVSANQPDQLFMIFKFYGHALAS